MICFEVLGKYVSMIFLSDWLNVCELTYVDTALCCLVFRNIFLVWLQGTHATFWSSHNCIRTSYSQVNEHILRYLSPRSLLLWTERRSVSINHLFLNIGNLELSNTSHSIKRLIKLHIMICSSFCLNLAVDVLSKCSILEEVFYISSTNNSADLGILDDKVAFTTIVDHCSHLKLIFFETDVPLIPENDIIALSIKCPNLEDVYISGHLTDSSVIAICKNCCNLKRIDLKNCRLVTDAAILALQTARNLNHLDALFFGKRVITPGAIISTITKLSSNLNTIHFGCNVLFASKDVLSCLSTTQKNLTILTMGCATNITDDDVIMLCNSCKMLAELTIRGHKNLTAKKSAIAIVNNLTQLRLVSFGQLRSCVSKEMLCILTQRFVSFTSIDFNCYTLEGVPSCEPVLVDSRTACIYDRSGFHSDIWYKSVIKELLIDKCFTLEMLSVTEDIYDFRGVFDQLIWCCGVLRVLNVCRLSHVDKRVRDLVEEEFTDENLVTLAHNCKHLEVLNINRRELVSDEGMTLMLSQTPRLFKLSCIACSSLTDATYTALARYCKFIVELVVDDCWFSDTSCDVLSVGCKRLAYLSKQRTIGDVTHESFVHLIESCPELTNVVSSPGQLSYTVQMAVHNNQDTLEGQG